MTSRLPEKVQIAAAFAALVLASFNLVATAAAADSTVTVDQSIAAGEYQEYPVVLQTGEMVKINLEVQSGPPVDFYFVDQTGYDEFRAVWPGNVGGFTSYFASLSQTHASSIDKAAEAPAEGIFYLVVANSNPTLSSRVVGSVETSTQFPTMLFTVAMIAIAVIFVIATIAALVITRSLRARVQQYVPPGQPSPQGQTHQHIASLKPVIQQTSVQACPRCGASVPRGATTCANCGARL